MCRRILCIGLFLFAGIVRAGDVTAITYHDIVLKPTGDAYAITRDDFERQMDYLKRNGYQPISLQTLKNARQGRAVLPDKAVLLTFDDGFKSFYEFAFPVLRAHGFPAVVCVVTSWIDKRTTPDDSTGRFMTWDDLRTLARSSLVEVESHTDNLHRNVVANPFGGRMPWVVTRPYDAATKSYETENTHAQRVRADLKRSVERIQAELGRRPDAIAWPYGMYDQTLVDIAAELGMRYFLTLDEVPGAKADPRRIDRITFVNSRGLVDIDHALMRNHRRSESQRFVEIDLGPFVGKDRAQQERLLSQLVARLQLLQVRTVIVSPFTADRKRALFYNQVVPIESDILGAVTHALMNRTEVRRLVLRLPDQALKQEVLRDLARLNWFTDVVVGNGTGAQTLANARAVLRHYKPHLRIGVVNGRRAGGSDFTLTEVLVDGSTPGLAAQVTRALEMDPRSGILLRRSSNTTDESLREALKAVRSAGAAHYGYGPDDFVRDAPGVLRIVTELHEHVAGAGPL